MAIHCLPSAAVNRTASSRYVRGYTSCPVHSAEPCKLIAPCMVIHSHAAKSTSLPLRTPLAVNRSAIHPRGWRRLVHGDPLGGISSVGGRRRGSVGRGLRTVPIPGRPAASANHSIKSIRSVRLEIVPSPSLCEDEILERLEQCYGRRERGNDERVCFEGRCFLRGVSPFLGLMFVSSRGTTKMFQCEEMKIFLGGRKIAYCASPHRETTAPRRSKSSSSFDATPWRPCARKGGGRMRSCKRQTPGSAYSALLM